MTRRISLIIGAAIAALTVGIPVASAGAAPILHVGVGSQDQSQQSDFWNYDAQGRKVADTSPGVQPGDLADLYSGPSDVGGQQVPQLRRSAPDSPANVYLRQRAEARSAWHAPDPASSEPVAAGAPGGDDIEWAQIGAGLGIGVLLGLGLLVALKGVRPHRPLPH
jgi:hypothetical protein